MNSPGRSAHSEYERLRQRRREKISKRWPLILIAAAIAFAFGFLLPKLLLMIPSALMSQLSLEPSEIALPVNERLVSLATGFVLGPLALPSASSAHPDLSWRGGRVLRGSGGLVVLWTHSAGKGSYPSTTWRWQARGRTSTTLLLGRQVCSSLMPSDTKGKCRSDREAQHFGSTDETGRNCLTRYGGKRM